jgi:histidinol dehydrogenase
MISPASLSGGVPAVKLAAAAIAGVDRVFLASGAQAIAALAYGTETIPRVDKICGPGNIFVTLAKRAVFGDVGIDSIYGPTETIVLADREADPGLCAADLIAQAEHDPRAVSVLVASSEAVARRTLEEVERQLQDLPRGAIARRSLTERGAAVVARDVAEAVRLADEFAPEHLVMLVRGAARWVKRISRAGAVFLGSSTPEAAGDYLAGPSHVLPTAGTARFASPLSVATFRRRMSVLELPARALRSLAPAIEALSAAEGLEGHARAVRVRLGPGTARDPTRSAGVRRGRRRGPPRAGRRRTGGRP